MTVLSQWVKTYFNKNLQDFKTVSDLQRLLGFIVSKMQTENYTGKYYLFGAFGWREQMGYATSDSMYGPWTWGGIIMEPTSTSNTNHPSVIDFKGKTYFIYHNGSLVWGSGFRRSVCVSEMTFNEDGTVPYIDETSTRFDRYCLIYNNR